MEMDSRQLSLCGLLLLLGSFIGTGAQAPTSYSSHREATTAALTRRTQAYFEARHPAKNDTPPIPPTLRPEQREYIDALYRRHLGYGVPSTYLHYVETVCDANELMAHPRGNRQNNFFWHQFKINRKLNMRNSQRILNEWKAAAIDIAPSYYEARTLIGQALHVVQDGYRIAGSEGLISSAAVNASVDFINDITNNVNFDWEQYIGMRSPFRGREIVIVIDNSFRNETLPRLRALRRWAVDHAAANWTKDIPPAFTIQYPRGIFAVYPSRDNAGIGAMTELLDRAVSECENPSKVFCDPPNSHYINQDDPRDILRIVDDASRYSEVGSTIFLLADTRFSTDYRLHAPLLQRKQQQLVIVGNPPDDHKEIYSDLAASTGGTVVFASNNEDDIYRSLGYLHHVSKDNLVIAAAVDNALELEQGFEIKLHAGDMAVGILIGRQDISVDLTTSGAFHSYNRGQWINAPANLTGSWRFKAKGATKGWSLQVYVQSDRYYNIGLYQHSDWTFYSELSSSRPWEHKGYVKVEGNPVIGDLITVLLTRPFCEGCDPESINTRVDLVAATNQLLETVTVREIDSIYYGADIRVPSQPFRVVVVEYHQPYTRYSKLFTPTHFAMSFSTNRPVEALPLQSRIGGTIVVNHPQSLSAQMFVKDTYSFLPSWKTEKQTVRSSKYVFNITTANEKRTELLTFVLLSDNEYESADNFVVQHVTAVAGERPVPTKCAIVESTHGQCASCDQVYSAKIRLIDEYDGFLHDGEMESFVGNWTVSNGLTKVLKKKYLGKDGNVAMEVDVVDAACCETVRAFARDANGDEGVACEFPRIMNMDNAGASALHVPLVFSLLATVLALAVLS